MATMIPHDIQDFTTEGEGQFYRFLSSTAKPDSRYIAWYLPDIDGREPDFLLFSDAVGLVIFEVKDWQLDQIRAANPSRFEIQEGARDILPPSSTGSRKTAVKVKLFRSGVEYVSRLQARRLVTGLEKFKAVEMDFKGITTIGQGFADEIFRVWHWRHPDIEIIPLNTVDNVDFMIRHVAPSSNQTKGHAKI